jgi:hypothetical protein
MAITTAPGFYLYTPMPDEWIVSIGFYSRSHRSYPAEVATVRRAHPVE